jgi:two-component system sensor histidine kinase KdpD
VVGVLGVRLSDADDDLTPDERRLLEAFASQAALALEATYLADEARQAALLRETEKLQTALLNSISHDLRTPLVSITGALSSLDENPTTLDAAAQRDLIETALGEAKRLNRLVGNLLDMTRLEAGALKLAKEPAEVQDLVGVALAQVEDRLNQREVIVDLPAALPLVEVDFVLMVQVLVNLLDNAVKYSPADTPIEEHARRDGGSVEVQVADRGMGIPQEALTRVFDKFYRVQRPNGIGGTGLGLSICRGIVEAHGGSIRAEAHPQGGAILTVTLPIYTPEPAR